MGTSPKRSDDWPPVFVLQEQKNEMSKIVDNIMEERIISFPTNSWTKGAN